jgi:osmotically-inducible protein OsmY
MILNPFEVFMEQTLNEPNFRGGFQNRDVGKSSFPEREEQDNDKTFHYAQRLNACDPSRLYQKQWPEGFAKSDASIQQDIIDELQSFEALSEVRIMVENGEVALSGQVTSSGMKDLAHNSVEKIKGVKKITNKISTRYS